MEQFDTWELLLLGAGILLLLFWFRPGLKAAFRQSQEAENPDWKGVLVPIGLVVLFVILLVLMVR